MSTGVEAGRAEGPGDPWADVPVDVPVDGPETLAEQRLLAAFGLRARAANLGRVVRLRELLERGDSGALDEEGRQEAESLAHQVVGSAGTFGQPAASRDAARVERYFAAARAASWGRPQDEREHVRDTIDRLRAQFGG